jgi:predicted GIY-YIG superfamily endonuclease
MCSEGPFRESEKDYKYISLHGKSGSNYCLRCARTLNISLEDIIDKSEIVENESIEVVSFNTEKPKRASIEDTKLKKKPKKDPIQTPMKEEDNDEPGPFYVYIGQFVDSSFLVGISKDISKDLDRINSGVNDKHKNLPMEIVYYHIEDTKKGAVGSKGTIMLMSYSQKEDLINTFAEEFFKK